MLENLQPMHLVGIILIPQAIMMLTNLGKALVWKYSSHLREGDLVLVAGEEAMIANVNFSGLHVVYSKTGNHRTISVSQLDKLDLRKIK